MRRTVEAVPEEPVQLRVNGRPVRSWTASPRDLEALAAGALLTAGFVRNRDDIRSLDVLRSGPSGRQAHLMDADIDPEAAEAGFEDHDHRVRHGCGVRFVIDCRPDRLPGSGVAARRPPGADFAELFRDLFERSPSRRDSGGHHTAALSDGQSLLHVHEEVGRHNAADKAIGAAVLADLDRRQLGLVTTARISGEIAEKAARAGLGWVASRSVPTTLAVAVAVAGGVTLVGRAASPEGRAFP